MSTFGKKQQQEKKARQRADIIMKVRSGVMTATEGAAALGISRKTYYKWENRALGAMLDGLEDRDTGRPELPEPSQDDVDLRKQLEELERQKELLEKRIELSNMVHKFELERVREQNRKDRERTLQKKRREEQADHEDRRENRADKKNTPDKLQGAL
jgi:DNA-binding XRE family transcriptional regulator